MNTKHLGELNTMRFWCSCQQGPADACTAHHVEQAIKTPGSNLRSLLIVGAMGLICLAVLMFSQWR